MYKNKNAKISLGSLSKKKKRCVFDLTLIMRMNYTTQMECKFHVLARPNIGHISLFTTMLNSGAPQKVTLFVKFRPEKRHAMAFKLAEQN